MISILVIISYWHFSGIDGRLKVCIDLQRLEIDMFILSFTGNTTTGNPDDEHPGWSVINDDDDDVIIPMVEVCVYIIFPKAGWLSSSVKFTNNISAT